MTDVNRARLAPQTGTAFRLAAGERLRVVDPCGEQVADLMAFAADDVDEVLSSGRSLDYNETLFLTTGHILYSNRSRPLLTIERDDVGRHDFLLTPCSPETFRIIYKQNGHHPSCLENLSGNLAPFGIAESRIPTTFNVFMNVQVAADGRLTVARPLSRAGDQIVFRAELDLIVGLTACSAEMSNNYAFKPIDYEVFS
ncbi:MAG: DUF1989 domain-containing protein [Candidatus Dormibacter sp.]|uniref:DUF1989 domain-containing protein n=1 Tax=Candidatus Dormibacter sp. TaxID=2973982 RepID=UPI000DB0C7D7|nr:MAG: urea carboxylase-associated protein [Candidatus Dormibacteraeota bacterium]